MSKELERVIINAFDLDDAWFQSLSTIIDKGHIYTITRGSYKGQKRLEFDEYILRVSNPSHQIIPIIPEGMSIPPPTSLEYLERYMNYLLTGQKSENEDYTYGERIAEQLFEVIDMYKTGGFGTNQACLEIGKPSDIKLDDPPCLRLIDTRVRYNKLHFFVYFRSWDLWGGFPSNLGAIQKMKEFMAEEIGVKDGELVAYSKGLHLYDHCFSFAEQRTGKIIKK